MIQAGSAQVAQDLIQSGLENLQGQTTQTLCASYFNVQLCSRWETEENNRYLENQMVSSAIHIILVLSPRTLHKQAQTKIVYQPLEEKSTWSHYFLNLFLEQQDLSLWIWLSRIPSFMTEVLIYKDITQLGLAAHKKLSTIIFFLISHWSLRFCSTQNSKEIGLHCTESNISYALSTNYCSLLPSVAVTTIIMLYFIFPG